MRNYFEAWQIVLAVVHRFLGDSGDIEVFTDERGCLCIRTSLAASDPEKGEKPDIVYEQKLPTDGNSGRPRPFDIRPYEEAIDRISQNMGLHLMRTEIIPFCDRFDLYYISGMGTAFFCYRRTGVIVYPDEVLRAADRDLCVELERITQLLESEMSGEPLFHWTEDYNTPPSSECE